MLGTKEPVALLPRVQPGTVPRAKKERVAILATW